jgi:uncharacterized heparinase superfamily protein
VSLVAPSGIEACEDPPTGLGDQGTDGGSAADELRQGRLTLLRQTRAMALPDGDWMLGERRTDRLWAITLHYHQWLAQAAREPAARPLVDTWINDWLERCDITAAGARDLAWNSYAIATRLGWWAAIWRAMGNGALLSRKRQFLNSYWRQAEHLSRHVEWDLRANHVMRDAVGLLWAGRFLQGDRPRRWLEQGTALAVEQARQQVLPDGGHYERSPMYHRHVMHDVATAATLAMDRAAAEELRSVHARMDEFYRHVVHPDGRIALFNDSALGQGECPAMPASSRPMGAVWMADTGMIVFHGQTWTVFFDVGAVGPDEQPGHAHADTLSIECSCGGSRLLVDPGTFGYDDDETRRYDRATASHNTVTIDGADSSEVWHIFRVGRRARVHDIQFEPRANGFNAHAWHDGYGSLPGGGVHRRRLSVEGPMMRIEDRIEGRGRRRVEGGWLIGPDWHVAGAIPGGWRLEGPGGGVSVEIQGPQDMDRHERCADYHPEFGQRLETRRVGWSMESTLPVCVTTTIRRL